MNEEASTNLLISEFGGKCMNKMTKSRCLLLLAMFVVFAAFLSGCNGGGSEKAEGNNSSSSENVVNIFNWSEYLPESVIKAFEDETGIKVNYDAYSSNEEMLAKLSAGNTGYDLSVASTNFVDIMIKRDLIEKFDTSTLSNLSNIGESFMGIDEDPTNEYSVPYMWGSAIIAYNKDLVKEDVTGFEDLFKPEFENSLVLLDDQRTILGSILAMLGYSPNTTDEAEINEAKEKMLELYPNIKAFDSDSPKTLLISGEVKAGIVWSAEAILAQKENPAIEIVYPENGMNIWQDNFLLVKGAPNKENALKFIDFILRPEISVEISKEYPYGNPNVKALELLPEDIKESIEVPQGALDNGWFLKDVGEATLLYDEAWSQIKQ